MRSIRLLRALGDRRGMTIAEVLLAVAVVGGSLATLASVIPTAAYGLQEGNQLSTATFLAEQRMEQVRNTVWQRGPAAAPIVDSLGVSSAPAATPVGGSGTPTFPDENPIAAPYGNYWRTVRITDCGTAPGCGGIISSTLRQVAVIVGYRPMTIAGRVSGTPEKNLTLTMYIARR